MARADTSETIERHADIAGKRLGQCIHRKECKTVAFRRLANTRDDDKRISREEQVDDGSVGTTMHGANELPILRFHDQACWS